MLVPGYDVRRQPLLQQLIGILKFDDATYRDIKMDESASDTAVSVVTVGIILNSLPALVETDLLSFTFRAAVNILLNIGAWMFGSFVLFLVASYALNRRSSGCTFLQYLRLSGFAHAAWWLSALSLLALVDSLSFLTTPNWAVPVGLAIALWGFACSVKATVCAFDFGVWRALGAHFLAAALICVAVIAVLGQISLSMITML